MATQDKLGSHFDTLLRKHLQKKYDLDGSVYFRAASVKVED